jgi:hypothetical protein
MSEPNELLDEVQELTWALVDEQASEHDVRRLEKLLLEHEDARQTYVLCMQIHTDLHFLLGRRPPLPPALVEAIEQQKAKHSRASLPVVDLPPSQSHTSYTNGCT